MADLSSAWRQPLSDITQRMTLELRQSIVTEVLSWLKNAQDAPMMQFDLKTSTDSPDTTILQFSRSVVNIKTCSNAWAVWRIATSTDWPEIISVPIEQLGLNSMEDGFILPNEIRSENYGNDTSPTILKQGLSRFEIAKRRW